jgi:hypothetical protein
LFSLTLLGDDQNVQRRGPLKIPGSSALPLRIVILLGTRPECYTRLSFYTHGKPTLRPPCSIWLHGRIRMLVQRQQRLHLGHRPLPSNLQHEHRWPMGAVKHCRRRPPELQQCYRLLKCKMVQQEPLGQTKKALEEDEISGWENRFGYSDDPLHRCPL